MIRLQVNHLEDKRLRYLELEGLLKAKEKAIQNMEGEKIFLEQQYTHAKNEVGGEVTSNL